MLLINQLRVAVLCQWLWVQCFGSFVNMFGLVFWCHLQVDFWQEGWDEIQFSLPKPLWTCSSQMPISVARGEGLHRRRPAGSGQIGRMGWLDGCWFASTRNPCAKWTFGSVQLGMGLATVFVSFVCHFVNLVLLSSVFNLRFSQFVIFNLSIVTCHHSEQSSHRKVSHWQIHLN